MIFRRSTKTPPARNTTKNPMQQAVNNGQNQTSGNNLTARREPAFGTSSTTQTTVQPMVITPPISPLAAAQARRNPNGPTPGFARQDQPRKLTVGRDITLNGEIATCDHLIVEGTVTATVKDGQVLEILEKGSFSGTVEIEQADIAGKFDGDLTVRNKLVIRSTATVTGTIRYGSLQVDHGAVLNGDLAATPKQNATTATTTILQDTPAQNITNSGVTMQQNTYLSSVLDQPGFLKMSGQ